MAKMTEGGRVTTGRQSAIRNDNTVAANDSPNASSSQNPAGTKRGGNEVSGVNYRNVSGIPGT